MFAAPMDSTHSRARQRPKARLRDASPKRRVKDFHIGDRLADGGDPQPPRGAFDFGSSGTKKRSREFRENFEGCAVDRSFPAQPTCTRGPIDSIRRAPPSSRTRCAFAGGAPDVGDRARSQRGRCGEQDLRRRAHWVVGRARCRARVRARHVQQRNRHVRRRRGGPRTRRRSSIRPRQIRDTRRTRHRRLPVDLVLRAAARRRHVAHLRQCAAPHRYDGSRHHRGDARRQHVRRVVRATPRTRARKRILVGGRVPHRRRHSGDR